jgi:transcriptional regulator with XRE-family HTH domain
MPTKNIQDEPTVALASARFTRGRHAGRTPHLSLAAARAAAAKTQVQVSEASGIAQGDVSKLERREDLDDVQVSTLRRYVEALGGELELVAVVGGRRIVLGGAAVANAPQARRVAAARAKAKP